jgi:hypothetical protein
MVEARWQSERIDEMETRRSSAEAVMELHGSLGLPRLGKTRPRTLTLLCLRRLRRNPLYSIVHVQ